MLRIQVYYCYLFKPLHLFRCNEFCSVFPVGCWLQDSGRSALRCPSLGNASSACCVRCIGTYGHKDSVGIYFRGLGFTLLCEFSFRFSYRFSGSHTRLTHVVRIATHSVCFLVCLVAFVLASTLKALTA